MNISLFGDQGLLVNYGESISRENNLKVKALYHQLSSEDVPGILALIPSYNSLCIYFQKKIIQHNELKERIKKLEHPKKSKQSSGKNIQIPVLYGGKWGPDLTEVAAFHEITTDKLIHLHSQQDFFVYTMGFMPGFAYLGDFPSEKPTPRKETPRTFVEAGSVGLAGFQTAVYPSQSAGGWQIIGRSPIPLIMPDKKKPFLIGPEDGIRFYPIDEAAFRNWQERLKEKSFKWEELYE